MIKYGFKLLEKDNDLGNFLIWSCSAISINHIPIPLSSDWKELYFICSKLLHLTSPTPKYSLTANCRETRNMYVPFIILWTIFMYTPPSTSHNNDELVIGSSWPIKLTTSPWYLAMMKRTNMKQYHLTDHQTNRILILGPSWYGREGYIADSCAPPIFNITDEGAKFNPTINKYYGKQNSSKSKRLCENMQE